MRYRKTKMWTLLLIILLSTFTVVLAEDEVRSISIPAKDYAKVSAVLSSDALTKDLQPRSGASEDISFGKIVNAQDDKLEFNMTAFGNATEKSRKEAVKELVKLLQDSSVPEQTQQSIFDQLGEADPDVQAILIPLIFDSTRADVFSAMKIIAPFLPAIRMILGLVAIGLFLGILASTLIDLAVIGIPPIRSWGMGTGSDTKEGSGHKAVIVSDECYSVLKEVEAAMESGGYKQAVGRYFVRRSALYIVFGIAILYLIVGELGGVMSWLMSLGTGLIQ